ncbi:hypothetical protein HJFPF1_07764 [Paramyrothecium foliicola]|nr:hypothetical protein HJFPF1_07764 [Paramyrothecium foliicola]
MAGLTKCGSGRYISIALKPTPGASNLQQTLIKFPSWQTLGHISAGWTDWKALTTSGTPVVGRAKAQFLVGKLAFCVGLARAEEDGREELGA